MARKALLTPLCSWYRLVAHGAVDLPFGAGRHWLQRGGSLGVLLGAWQLSAIVSAQSGAYFDGTVLDPTNRLGVTPQGIETPRRACST